ncbi:MAG: type II secretion system F family protein [Deferribacteraceae bacterium]|jgi:type II secretory pathway component PulF|nr:type II secretion system F family protein [Deferribacteraceae bacterium]
MPSFQYQGSTREGRSVKGLKEAASRQQALAELTAEGIFVSTLKQPAASKAKFSLLTKKINLTDLFFQLSLLLRSGIPLVEGLNIIARTSKSVTERETLMDVAAKVSEGVKFSDALSAHTQFFSAMYVNLIKASEKVGRLSEVLMDIATYEENRHKTKDKLKSAMVYPIVVFMFGFGVMGFMLTQIVPRMTGIFEAAEQELPSITKLLLSLSGFAQAYGLYLLLLMFLGMLGFRYLRQTNAKFSHWVDKRMYSIGIVGQAIVSRFAHILAFQLKEGLPLSDALYHATQTVTNSYVKGVLSNIREQVQAGVKFSQAVKAADIFPELFPAALTTGESSGNMPELIERVSQFYSKRIDTFTTAFLSIIEPLFIIILGVMIGFVVIAIMLPLLTINTMIG